MGREFCTLLPQPQLGNYSGRCCSRSVAAPEQHPLLLPLLKAWQRRQRWQWWRPHGEGFSAAVRLLQRLVSWHQWLLLQQQLLRSLGGGGGRAAAADIVTILVLLL